MTVKSMVLVLEEKSVVVDSLLMMFSLLRVQKNLEKLLKKVHKRANLNEITFDIVKCATMVIKPMNFQSPPNYCDPTFYLGMNAIPKVSSYVYLGIPFSDDILLEHIISHIHFKVRKFLLSFTHFFSNKLIPIAYKKKVLQSFVISKEFIILLYLVQTNLERPEFKH